MKTMFKKLKGGLANGLGAYDKGNKSSYSKIQNCKHFMIIAHRIWIK